MRKKFQPHSCGQRRLNQRNASDDNWIVMKGVEIFLFHKFREPLKVIFFRLHFMVLFLLTISLPSFYLILKFDTISFFPSSNPFFKEHQKNWLTYKKIFDEKISKRAFTVLHWAFINDVRCLSFNITWEREKVCFTCVIER